MLDLDDIQGIVFTGYAHMPHARFLLLQIKNARQARAWLTLVQPEIVPSTRRARGAAKPDCTAHIAFTCGGLSALGLDAHTMGQFPREFTEGMSLGERPRVLGDTGDSAPEYWQFGGPGNPTPHILLALYSATPAHIAEMEAKPWYPTSVDSGVAVIYQQESFRQSNNEPFGFRDGISQPVVAGWPTKTASVMGEVAAGEFVLGYINEYNNLSPAPTVAPNQDIANVLLPDSVDQSQKSFGMNGSYLVLRKLSQDVAGFWHFVESQTLAPDGSVDKSASIALAAKLVGRWPSGCPVTLSPDHDDAAIGADSRRNNDFLFASLDPGGLKCPIGSHVRRSNPRDVLHPNGSSLSMKVANRHRLTRRGRPYADETNAAMQEHGLVFIAINADLQRQFEFVQQTWLNNPTFNGLNDDIDPIAGGDDAPGNMTLQAQPVRKAIHSIPRFVTVRGGAYFFMPGLRALRFLANLPEPPPSAISPPLASPADSALPGTQVTIVGKVQGEIMATLHDAWAAVLSEGHKLHQELLNLREMVDKDLESLMAKPGLVKPLFTLLRHIRPIFVAPHIAAVSLYPDVLEVLGNDSAFSVAPIYAAKMEATTGDFVLGMDNTPQYQTEIGIMRSCIKPDDVGLLAAMAQQLAESQVAAAAATGGRLDAVGQLSRFVPSRIVGGFFGTPGPDDATNMVWMRTIFREIFLNLGNDPNMAAAAAQSSLALRAYLDQLVAQRKGELASGADLPDDFLCRMVKLQANTSPPFGDEVIRRLVGGTTVGTVDTNSKAIAQTLDQLLSRPLSLNDARNAASANDDALLKQIVFEALRFNPQNPFLIRKCEQDTVLAQGTPRQATIKTGSLILVGTESAMFDPDVFPEPDVFRSDRPMDKYIHFGHGQHACFGQHLAGVIIPNTLKPLLSRSGLKRADGLSIQYDGAFPNRFDVEFEV